jgi:hypothetical protein
MPERRKSADLDLFISSLPIRCVKRYWEIITDNLSKAGFSWGCSSQIDSLAAAAWLGVERVNSSKTSSDGSNLFSGQPPNDRRLRGHCRVQV